MNKHICIGIVLAALLGLVNRHFEPKRRSKEDILKGVKTV
jgi:hypothetical protein